MTTILYRFIFAFATAYTFIYCHQSALFTVELLLGVDFPFMKAAFAQSITLMLIGGF